MVHPDRGVVRRSALATSTDNPESPQLTLVGEVKTEMNPGASTAVSVSPGISTYYAGRTADGSTFCFAASSGPSATARSSLNLSTGTPCPIPDNW